MPLFNVPSLGGNSLNDVMDYLVQVDRVLKYLINGQLDSDNAREFGGWRISPDQFASKDGDVGMSTADTASDDIRFWAGNASSSSAPYRVYESGKLVASNADITGKVTATSGAIGGWVIDADSIQDASGVVGMSSAVTAGDDIRFWAGDIDPSNAPFRVAESGELTSVAGSIGGWTIEESMLSGSGILQGGIVRTAGDTTFPRIELTSTDNLLTAYSSATDFVQIKPDILNGTSVVFDNGTITTTFQTVHTGISDTFRIVSEDRIELNAVGPILLTTGSTVQLADFSKLYDVANSKDLQTALGSKLSGTGISGTVFAASTFGGAADTAISFINGARTA